MDVEEETEVTTCSVDAEETVAVAEVEYTDSVKAELVEETAELSGVELPKRSRRTAA